MLGYFYNLPYLALLHRIEECSDEESVVDETSDDADDVPDHQRVVGALGCERGTLYPGLLLIRSFKLPLSCPWLSEPKDYLNLARPNSNPSQFKSRVVTTAKFLSFTGS